MSANQNDKATDKLIDYQTSVRDIVSRQYSLGYSDAKVDALAAARDRTLFVGVICGIVGLASGLGLAGVL